MLTEIQLGSSIIVISYFAITLPIIDALFQKNKNVGYFYALIGMILTCFASIYTLTFAPGIVKPANPQELITKGTILFGGYTAFFDALFSFAGILTMIAAKSYIKREYKNLTEFYSLVTFAVAGMMVIGHSNSLLVLFVGIELMSIPFYILAGFIRNKLRPVEAALKYFLLGAFATGFLVYGMAMIYGSTGSLNLTEITEVLTRGAFEPIYLTIGLALLIIGLSFKAAAFPFHQWAADVYDGSPTVVSAFMSAAGKAAALVSFIIIARAILPSTINLSDSFDPRTIQSIIATISAATMIIGNITALAQKSVKRMLAYSSIAHAGYLLMGIVANSVIGWNGIAFYAAAYVFMQMGAFIIVSVFERDLDKNLNFEDYAGLSKSSPFLAGMMALFMFSLAGIPPMAGFFGKYYLFRAAIDAGFTWLTIVAVIASIVSMYYYIGLVIQMYFKEPEGETMKAPPSPANIALALTTVGTLLFGFFPSLLLDVIENCFKAM